MIWLWYKFKISSFGFFPSNWPNESAPKSVILFRLKKKEDKSTFLNFWRSWIFCHGFKGFWLIHKLEIRDTNTSKFANWQSDDQKSQFWNFQKISKNVPKKSTLPVTKTQKSTIKLFIAVLHTSNLIFSAMDDIEVTLITCLVLQISQKHRKCKIILTKMTILQ